jgi:osmotically-inducible protein OsmY
MNRRAFSLYVLGIFLAPLATAADKVVSDDLIYDRVRQKLATDPIVKGGGIDIEIKNGAIIMRGHLDSEKRKERAEKIARKVAGVKSVDNQIQVVTQ